MIFGTVVASYCAKYYLPANAEGLGATLCTKTLVTDIDEIRGL